MLRLILTKMLALLVAYNKARTALNFKITPPPHTPFCLFRFEISGLDLNAGFYTSGFLIKLSLHLRKL
jgi:hypothetical protein